MCLGQTVAVCLQAGYLLRRLDWQHAAVRNMQLLAPSFLMKHNHLPRQARDTRTER
jgi:hypothetical protein